MAIPDTQQPEREWTGEVMYTTYATYMADQGVSVDTWEQIEPTDRVAWNKLSELTQP